MRSIFQKLGYIIVLMQIFQRNIQLVLAGYIEVKDYDIDYINDGYTTDFKFTFSLQNGLGANNYLQLSFPFQIYISTHSALKARYTNSGESSCASPSFLPIKITPDKSSSMIYYFLFLDLNSQPTDLQSAPQWYTLYLQPERGFIIQTGVKMIVSAFTLSIDDTLIGKPILYDINYQFAVLEFTSPPATDLKVKADIPSTKKLQIAWQYEASFQIEPSIAISNYARIVVFQKNNYFKFTGTCISEVQSSPKGTIPPLDPSLYKCTVDTVRNRIVVELFTGIKANFSYRFKTTILNPNYAIPNAGFEVRTMMGFSNQIVEQADLQNAIYTDYLTWGPGNSNYKVFIGNNIDLSESSFVRKAAIISQEGFYNPYKFQFSPSLDTPDKIKLKIIIKIPLENNDNVLTGSIKTSLPRFNQNTPVKCILDPPTSPQRIVCTEIGKLSQNSFYYITASIYFAQANQINNDFGTMSLISIDPDYGEIIMIKETKANILTHFFLPKKNLDRVDYTEKYGFQFVHSQTSYDASSVKNKLVEVKPDNYGLKMCIDVKQKLVFTFKKGPNNEFGVNQNFAMRLITSTSIKASQGVESYFESLNPLCDPKKEFNTAATRRITTYSTFTEVLFNPQGSSNCIQSEIQTSTFSIGDVTINAHSSSYADSFNINFYGALYDSFVDDRTPNRYFAINAFTTSMSGGLCAQKDLQGITVSISNYYTSQGSQTNKADGKEFPALIRVTGFLTDAEKLEAKRIAVFFNNVDFFTESTDEFGRTFASCASSSDFNQKCWGFSGQSDQSSSIHTMKRVEFDVSNYIASITSSTPLQLLVPVSAMNNLNVVRVFVSILKGYPSDATQSNTYITSCTTPSYFVFTGTTAAPESKQENISYRLDSTSKIQGKKSLADLYIGHNNVVPKILRNTDSPTVFAGAGFSIIGNWKMYSNSLSVKESNNIVNTLRQSEMCLGFQYNYLGSNMRYGIFCPFSKTGGTDAEVDIGSKITFQDFIYPSLGPLKLDNTFITWSQNTGNVVSYFKDVVSTDQTALLQPNKVTDVSNITVNRFTKDNRIVWLFTSSNPIPKDGRIQISLVDSNGWLFSVSEASNANCYLMYQKEDFEDPNKITCTVTTPTTNNIVFTLSGDKDFPAGKFKLIQYGFDASDDKIDAYYVITITTQTSSGEDIDKQDSLPEVKLTFDSDEKWNSVIDILSYQFSHKQIEMSHGTFEMQFKIKDRPILALSSFGYGISKGQSLEIQVAALAGQESNINCQLMQDSKIYFGFKAIDLSNAQKINFYPRKNILTTDNTFTFRCENVVNQYKTFQSFQVRLLYKNGQSEVIKGGTSPSGTSNPPYKTPNEIANIILTKFNSLAGANSQLKFTMTLLLQQINQQASIFVTFPIKYNPKVGTNVLACKINNIDVYCSNVGTDRKIQISAFPITIPVTTIFNIDIYGIQSPISNKGDGDIQVLVGSTNDPSSIVEGKIIFDPATQSNSSKQLEVRYATQQNSNARESGIYTYQIIPSDPVGVNQNLQIEFPYEYGTAISISPPTQCIIYSENKSVKYGEGCNIFGTKITIHVTTQIPANNLVLIEISSIQNPEQSTCIISKVMISVLSQDFIQNTMQSTIATSNQPNQKFNQSTTLKYLDWKMNGKLIKYNINMIEIVAGVYSSKISLIDPSNNFNKMLTYSLKSLDSANFSLISDLTIYPGQKEETFRIGCPSSTLPGVFTLSFTKIEKGTQIYGNLGLMNVKVSNSQIEIVPAYTTYKVSVLGQSLPVFFDLSDNIPYESITIQFELQIMGLDPKIDILDDENLPVIQHTITFSPKSYKSRLYVRSSKLISPIYPDHKVKLKMTISGPDSASYKPSTKDIVFSLFDIGMNPAPPNLDFKPSIPTSDILQNSLKLIVNVNIPSMIYYHVRFQAGPVRPLEEIIQQVNKYTQLNPMDIYQEQFGILNAEEATNSFKIGNLRSKQSYRITTWAFDQLQRKSAKDDKDITTKSNGGKQLKINIQFANIISNTQKLNIACYLCELFAIPCFNIMTYDSIYCESQSQYKLEIVDSVNVNSRRALERQYNERNLADVISATIVQFYTLPLDELENDTSYSKIIPIVQSQQFGTKLNAFDLSLPKILSVENPIEIQPQTTPQLINQPIVSTGIQWFYVDKVETKSNSLIWMYLIDSTNGGTPSSQQMKFKLTHKNQTNQNFKIFYFDSKNQVSHNFTNLQPDTQYSLYMIATTENPSLFAPTSFVSSLGKKTLTFDIEVVISAQKLVFSILIVIGILII